MNVSRWDSKVSIICALQNIARSKLVGYPVHFAYSFTSKANSDILLFFAFNVVGKRDLGCSPCVLYSRIDSDWLSVLNVLKFHTFGVNGT